MKKSSLLALSMVSLVALVGCGKNGNNGGGKKDSEELAILKDFTASIWGRDFVADIEPLEDVLPTWADEDAKSEYILFLGADTSAEVNAAALYEAVFVAAEGETQSEMDKWLATYDNYSTYYSRPVAAASGSYYGYYDFEYDDVYVNLYIQIMDLAGTDQDTGEAYAYSYFITIASLFDQE